MMNNPITELMLPKRYVRCFGTREFVNPIAVLLAHPQVQEQQHQFDP